MDFGSGLSREEVIDRAGRLRDRGSALGGDSGEIVAVTKGFGSMTQLTTKLLIGGYLSNRVPD